MNKLVSIILPTYNTGEYIFDMLDSIKYQTYPNIELIIVDDNSSDGTYDRILHWYENLTSSNQKIIILKNEKNIGLTKTVNIGYQKCSGEYVFLSDHDDIWSYEKVEKQVGIFEKNKDVVICFHDREMINRENETICQSEYKYINFNQESANANEILEKKIRYSANTLSFKNIVEAKSIFPIPKDIIEHDYYLTVCFSLFGKIRYVQQPLVKYRIHEENLSGNYALEVIKTYKSYKTLMKKGKRVSNDSMIIKKHIEDVFSQIVDFPLKKQKRYTIMVKKFIPIIHYMYIKIHKQKKFSES